VILYFLSFSWGLVILFSFIGWGGVINRLLFPQNQIDWGQKAAWGIAFSIFVGGILNVISIISRTTIFIYLGAGLLYWLFDVFKTKFIGISLLSQWIRDLRNDKLIVVGIFVIFSLVFLQYAGAVSTQKFNQHDDYHAYFVFPIKMLQTGSMGPDPFSERRMMTSLGGQPFLQTFVLTALFEKNLYIIDGGLGIIITTFLLLGYFKNKGTPKRAAVFILLFFLLIPITRANTTALVTPLALFISLFRTIGSQRLKPKHLAANAFIIALLSAAICSLKSSLIPPCGIFFAVSYFCYITTSETKKKAAFEFLIATILVGIFLLPWMISMYQSSGTLLYPLFGKGYHGSVYGTFLLPSAGLTVSTVIGILRRQLGNPYIVSLLLLSFVAFSSSFAKLVARGASLALWTSSVLGIIILSISMGGPSSRFYFSFVCASIIILMTIALSGTELKNQTRFTNYTSAFIAVLVAGIIIGSNWQVWLWSSPKFQYARCIKNIKSGLRNIPLTSNEEVVRYNTMQRSVPQGQTILARLAYPFLLDFKRNTVFIIDWPGGASPPPGIPSFRGPEPLADYLSLKSIRYIAYSYADEANFTWKEYGSRVNHTAPWIRSQARHTFAFQNNLIKLAKTRKRIYDDGYIFVIDLLSHRG